MYPGAGCRSQADRYRRAWPPALSCACHEQQCVACTLACKSTSRYWHWSYLGRHGIQYDRPQPDIVIPATNWGSIADNGCQSNGTHKYSAILWNIPWGQSWETACHSTPGPAGTPVAGRLPTDCVTSLNEWGEWYLPDPHCPQPKPPPPRCPAGCYESNVACIAGIVWNACWCYGGNGMCPTGTWWPAGVCIGAWTLGCTP